MLRSSAAALGLLFAVSTPGVARTLYVSPDGNDEAAGSEGAPFATLQKAHDVAVAGDTVLIAGGTFRLAGNRANGVTLSRSGQSGKRIHFFAAPGATPVLDASGLAAQARITGLRVTGSWLHLRGLELKGVPQRITTAHESWGIWVSGSGNVFERLRIHHIQGPGLFIADGGNNLVLDCDSHDNYDPLSSNGAGENADGFGCHSSEPGNVFRGCRAWWNSDDGYDVISAEAPVRFEACWAFRNGYLPGTREAGRNGSGFKVGKSHTGVRHRVERCLAFDNRSQGFYANHSLGGNDWIHNTAYSNGGHAFDLLSDTVLAGDRVHRLRNNVAMGRSLVGNRGAADSRSNTWDLGLAVAAEDFVSVAMDGVDAPRGSDGALPRPDFLRPRSGGRLIDKGMDAGLAFHGVAPDLGAYETGAPTVLILDRRSPKARPGLRSPGTRPWNGRWADLRGRLLPAF